MNLTEQIETAAEKYRGLLKEQAARSESLNSGEEFIDFGKLQTIKIGVVYGDGIGPAITRQARRVLAHLLVDGTGGKKIEIRDIEGLTIENRAKTGKTLPDGVLEKIRECNVILKGPTTTPEAGSKWPNVESANVVIRKELDLFANVRPVRIPDEGIDWTFFRENTEGAYAVGSKGMEVTPELSVDFTVTTKGGSERIAKAAFDYARDNGKTRVTAVTKANVIKTTDGMFLRACREVANLYPGITLDEWYVDIMAAKLIDKKRRAQFQVFVLPNLYGDILTDEAAEFMGGVGTAGSANIGKRYAMFEAIHGSAPRMVTEGRDIYADPSSIMRAAAMLLAHIGFNGKAGSLTKALDTCCADKKNAVTGRPDGVTSEAFGDYVLSLL